MHLVPIVLPEHEAQLKTVANMSNGKITSMNIEKLMLKRNNKRLLNGKKEPVTGESYSCAKQ